MSRFLTLRTTSRGRWLAGSAAFDGLFVGGTLIVALGLGAMASVSPAMLVTIALIDVWIFANPHVVATYTRIGSHGADGKRNWFLIFVLPAIVLAGVTATSLAYEVAGLFVVYFIAQNYHVSRQSFGIAKRYRKIEGSRPEGEAWSTIVIYLVPLWGLLNRCAQSPEEFLGYPITLPVIPLHLSKFVGCLALACVLFWVVAACRAAQAGRLNWRHDGFVASHVCVSIVGYVWISDITVGWLVVNIWHNMQYLLFVWSQNRQRAESERSSVPFVVPFKSVLRGECAHGVRFFGFCLVIGALLYEIVDFLGGQLLWLGLPTVLIAHFTINFHHYLVDGVIWKRRRQQQNLRALRTPLGYIISNIRKSD